MRRCWSEKRRKDTEIAELEEKQKRTNKKKRKKTWEWTVIRTVMENDDDVMVWGKLVIYVFIYILVQFGVWSLNKHLFSILQPIVTVATIKKYINEKINILTSFIRNLTWNNANLEISYSNQMTALGIKMRKHIHCLLPLNLNWISATKCFYSKGRMFKSCRDFS